MNKASVGSVAQRSIRGIAPFLFALTFGAIVSPVMAEELPKVGDTAADFELNALDKGKVKLSSLTKSGSVVLVVLRGFPGYQCPLCTRQVGELMGRAKEFSAAKTQVIMVYPGPAEGLKAHAVEFVQGKTLPKPFRIVLDPDFQFTSKYALRWDAPNETAYPSTFVIDRKRKIVFAKVSHSHGDRAQTDAVLKALPK